MDIDVEELPVWIVDKVEDDPEQPGRSLVTLHLEAEPESWMTVRLAKEDAADIKVGTKARYAVVSTEVN